MPEGIVVTGGLEKEIVVRILRRHWNEVKYCYEKELAQNPKLAGRVLLSMNVNDEGKTQTVAIQESTLKNANAEACMQRTAERWVYPASKESSAVRWSLDFNPR